MLRVLENFGDLLGEFTRLRIKPYSWLRSIIVKGCKAESIKGNGMWRTSGGNQLKASESPSIGVRPEVLNSSKNKL